MKAHARPPFISTFGYVQWADPLHITLYMSKYCQRLMDQIPRLPEVATGAMATPVNGRRICMPDATVECHNPHLIIFYFGLFGNKGRSHKYYTFQNFSITTFLKLLPTHSHVLRSWSNRDPNNYLSNYLQHDQNVIVYRSTQCKQTHIIIFGKNHT